MLSNGPGMQPRSVAETELQYNQLLSRLSISSKLSVSQKLERLRNTPAQNIVHAAGDIALHEFRAISDGVFVRDDLFREINSGDFGKRLKQAGVKIMLGECRDEHRAYAIWRAPKNSAESMFKRLCADYTPQGCEKLMQIFCPGNVLPDGASDWSEMFGRVYANVQVHCMQRGLLNGLFEAGLQPGTDILRYRINWRIKGAWAPIEWGVTHATDVPIWFLGNGNILDDDEKAIAKRWLEPLSSFLKGKDASWGTTGPKEMRRLNEMGEVDIWEDDQWLKGQEVWELLTKESRVSKL